MALVYNAGYDYESVIGDKKIKFRQWTAKEERKYLSSLEDEKTEFTDKTIYETLIKPCIEDKEIVLSATEQKKLLIDIRIESISDELEDNGHECPHCGVENDIKVKINDFMKYKPANYSDIESGGMKFIMGPIRTNKEKERLKLKDGVVNYVFNDFLLHIHAVEIDGELNENFKFTEIQKFMDSLPTKIFDDVFEKYKDMIDELEMTYTYTCPACLVDEEIDYSTIPGLLWA